MNERSVPYDVSILSQIAITNWHATFFRYHQSILMRRLLRYGVMLMNQLHPPILCQRQITSGRQLSSDSGARHLRVLI